MATKSFLKNIVIKDKKKVGNFLSALENAEKKGRKNITIDMPVKTLKNKESIRKMFGA